MSKPWPQGLADALAGAETLRSDAETLAEDIAKSAPLAVVSVRATLRAGLADEIARATERGCGSSSGSGKRTTRRRAFGPWLSVEMGSSPALKSSEKTA